MSEGLHTIKVLLVDDNQHMRAIVAAILKGVGVRHIRECRDGSEALAAMRDWPADIAIIDYQMHPMDGVEFTRRVRSEATSADPYLPIIMMTGFAERQKVLAARDSGVTEFLVKPVTARGVLDRLNAVVFKPRPFVRSGSYFGPTRRRLAAQDNPFKRRAADSDANKLEI